MRAVTYTRYGAPGVLRATMAGKPTPAQGELLVKIYATTVTSGDRRLRSMDMPHGFGLIARAMFGIAAPRNPILGSEFAGEVESIGSNVTRFKVGDRVLGSSGLRAGCHAEYVCISETSAVASKPEGLSYRKAAALSFGGLTALDFLRRAELRPREKILINGASGCVGSAAVQLANYFGGEVTGVCSPANKWIVKSLGAHHVIDYTTRDFAAIGETYDVIFDTVGNCSYRRASAALKRHGRLVLAVADARDLLHAPLVLATTSKRMILGPITERSEDVSFLACLAAQGRFSPLLDRTYTLEEIVAAHQYVDAGRKRGSVVIDVISEAKELEAFPHHSTIENGRFQRM